MADATTATTPKIEELRAKVKADPKSRHFYPLAEELRKIQKLEEAEQILRAGLQTHPAYLSGWICLGRVLRDRDRDHEAVEVLKRALELDPGNVVAAKLLAQSYLGIGDKIEAIKKFKLVFALMPSDEDVEASIETLDRELHPENYPPEAAMAPRESVAADAGTVEPFALGQAPEPAQASEEPLIAADQEPSRFDSTDPLPFGGEEEPFGSTADSAISSLLTSLPTDGSLTDEPLSLAGVPSAVSQEQVSPFDEEPEPFGDVAQAPASGADRDVAEPEPEPEREMDLEEPSAPAAPIPATMTMAHLYESQGHEQQAAELYRQILDQKPDHELARVALSRAEAPARDGKVAVIRRLEQWRERVARR